MASVYEGVLSAIGLEAKLGTRPHISQAKRVLRAHGEAGGKLASKLSKLSKLRNTEVHDSNSVALEREIIDFLRAHSQSHLGTAMTTDSSASGYAAAQASDAVSNPEGSYSICSGHNKSEQAHQVKPTTDHFNHKYCSPSDPEKHESPAPVTEGGRHLEAEEPPQSAAKRGKGKSSSSHLSREEAIDLAWKRAAGNPEALKLLAEYTALIQNH